MLVSWGHQMTTCNTWQVSVWKRLSEQVSSQTDTGPRPEVRSSPSGMSWTRSNLRLREGGAHGSIHALLNTDQSSCSFCRKAAPKPISNLQCVQTWSRTRYTKTPKLVSVLIQENNTVFDIHCKCRYLIPVLVQCFQKLNFHYIENGPKII